MQPIVIDPDSAALKERFALIKTPRRNRKRFPEGCVTVMASLDAALAAADAGRNLFPAVVYGPSASSEGQKIYYLVHWLDGADT
jgi:hypothetical protein